MKRTWLFAAGILLFSTVVAIMYLHKKELPQPQVNHNYTLIKKPCWFDAPWQKTIVCAELHTPFASGEFVLPVVIIKDDSPAHYPDPLVYLAGGPGASARLHTEGIESWLQWMGYANLGRDLILMDPRGTGRSKPQLQCAAFNRFNKALLGLDLPLAEELEQSFLLTKRCFENLAEAEVPVHSAYFGSVISAQDVRGLMAQLDYAEWNLVGVSYGTRLALEIARQEIASPQSTRLRSMVLDSVYPAGYGGVQTWPQVLDEAFQQFFIGCIARETCMAPLAELKNQPLPELLTNTLTLLRDNAQQLSIRRWDGEAPVNFLVNDHRFLSASFAAIYDPLRWPDITAAIYAVHNYQADGLETLIEPFINNSFSPDFNNLAFMAVDCADNPVLPEGDYNARVEKFPLFSEYTRDQWRYQICQVLSVNSDLYLELVKPQVPTLMLSGKLDPITPVEWAKELKEYWPELQLLVRDEVAHAVLGSDACMLANMGTFLNEPLKPFEGCKVEDKKELAVKN